MHIVAIFIDNLVEEFSDILFRSDMQMDLILKQRASWKFYVKLVKVLYFFQVSIFIYPYQNINSTLDNKGGNKSTCSCGSSSPRASKRGSRTRPMKLTWDEGLVTLSRSINGVTGSPSSFSASLCLKNSCSNLSSHGSATSIGRASLLISATLMRIIDN